MTREIGSALPRSSGATVDAEEAGVRLDRWFKRHYPTLGHGPLEKLLRTGQVRVNGKRASASDRLQTGQTIRIPPQLQGEPAQVRTPAPLGEADKDLIERMVIHEDASVFVLNKPSG